MTGFVATAETDVRATPQQVWAALTEPGQIAAYMGGSRVETDWEVGGPITWSGEYDGHAYQDRGTVLAYDEPRLLSVTHYSPLSGQEDRPESYHTLVYTLTPADVTPGTPADGPTTHLALTQDGCTDEAQAQQFSQSWQQMLDGLTAHVEG